MPGPVLGTLAHLPKALVAGVAGAVVLAGGAVAAVQLTSGNDADQLSDASKVLQSVDVGIGQNGRLTSIKGTTVGTTTSGEQFSVDNTYEPGEVADQLPVRVLTSYRTAKGTGTDLSDLDGYTGRVDITLTVQNLTQKAKNVTFDVGGTQQSRSALVGVPLTVVGSTALSDTKPSDVVSQSGSDDDSGTNGVLSQDAKGKTQVQWATLLAPPQLGASTAMNLSVNAKDFQVPDFDLSVQPGLVTDPSIGSVLNEAFAPEGSSQLALTRRTIDLIGKVNGVLGQAGKSMSQVRTTLNNSSKTLGTKTVSDLKGSTETIASSVKGLQESSQSLGQDLTTSLKGTQSTTLAELQATNQAIDKLLGDTSAPQPVARIVQGSNQCAASVERPKGATSIYGNLQEIVALLKGYSTATNNCSGILQKRILDAVGPADAESCKDSVDTADNTSATCSLFSAKDTVLALARDLNTSGQKAINAFTESIGDLNLAVNGTSACDVGIDLHGTEKLDDDTIKNPDACGLQTASQEARNYAERFGRFAIRRQSGTPPRFTSTAIKAAAAQAKSSLVNLNKYLYDSATQGLDSVSAAQSTDVQLTQQVCQSVSDENAQRDILRFASNRDCQGRQIDRNFEDANLASQLADQSTRWNQLKSDFDPGLINGTLDPNAVGPKMNDLNTAIDGMVNQADVLADDIDEINDKFNIDDIRLAFQRLNLWQQEVGTKAKTVSDAANSSLSEDDKNCDLGSTETDSDSTCSKLQQSFDTATDAAGSAVQQIAGDGDQRIRTISASGTKSADDVKTLFDSSLGKLSQSANEIAQESKKTISSQKATFAVRQKQSGDRISASVTKGLKQVDAGVGSSVKDLGAAKKILQGDITDVLLDLGTRDVKGSGLLGAIARSAATTGTANFQLAQATTTASSYANVRQGDVADLLLRQAQAQAGQEAQAALPAFALSLPDSTRHTTVYSLHVTP